MVDASDRSLLLALAALYQVAETASKAPVEPSLALRALLAMIHARSDGDRGSYEAFWKRVIAPGRGEANDGYLRATNARTEWSKIVRSVGLPPGGRFLDHVGELLRLERERTDPDLRARSALARAVRESVYDREIIATKGHPHSEAGRRLMAERIARGEDPAP